MRTKTHFDSFTEARSHLKELLDAAHEGRPATLRRDTGVAAVVNADNLRAALALLPSLRPVAVAEAGGWSLFIPGVPVAGDGSSFEEAVADFVDALREYEEDWDRLRVARNHQSNWGLVQLVALSDDETLRAWVTGASAE